MFGYRVDRDPFVVCITTSGGRDLTHKTSTTTATTSFDASCRRDDHDNDTDVAGCDDDGLWPSTRGAVWIRRQGRGGAPRQRREAATRRAEAALWRGGGLCEGGRGDGR